MESIRLVKILVLGLAIVYGNFHIIEAEFDMKVCKSTMAQLTKANMQLVPLCAKTMKFKNGKEKSKKQNCILRCALVKAGITDETGQVSPDSMEALMKKYDVPDDMIDRANRTFYPCFDIGIKTPFKSLEEDPFCSSYDAFIKCFMQNMGNVCT